MAEPAADDSWPRPTGPDPVDGLGELPIDPDLDAPAEPHGSTVRRGAPRGGLPRIHWMTVLVVALGGLLGGLARYGVGEQWPAHGADFPWGIWGVNTGGAFILAFVLVLVLEVLPPTRYVRAFVGTGFCGALTTFSSVATDGDQLAAHGHTSVAVAYVAGSLAAGLAAAMLGIVLGRSVAAYREKGRD